MTAYVVITGELFRAAPRKLVMKSAAALFDDEIHILIGGVNARPPPN
jgi:hypothetical protein